MTRMIVSGFLLTLLSMNQVFAERLPALGLANEYSSSGSINRIRHFDLLDDSIIIIKDFHDGIRQMIWGSESITLPREHTGWINVMQHVKKDNAISFEMLLDMFDQIDTGDFLPIANSVTSVPERESQESYFPDDPVWFSHFMVSCQI